MRNAFLWLKYAALVAVPLIALSATAQTQTAGGNQQSGQSGQKQATTGSQTQGSNANSKKQQQSSGQQNTASQDNNNQAGSNNSAKQSDSQAQSQSSTQQNRIQDRNVRAANRNDTRQQDTRNALQNNRQGRRDARNMRASDLGFKFNTGNNSALVISDVPRSSRIARFGFRSGDRIVSVNGHRVVREDDLLRYLLVRDVDRVTVIVIRDGREETIYVEPAVFYDDADYVVYDPLQEFGIVIEERNNTVVVVRVIDGSPAFKAGIRQGDVLLTVSGRTYRTKTEIEKAIRDLKTGKVNVQVRRDGKSQDLSVNVPERKQSQDNQQPDGDSNASDRNDSKNANDRKDANQQKDNKNQNQKDTNRSDDNNDQNQNDDQRNDQNDKNQAPEENPHKN
jgi:C-terminal processing protease CtpA/Prc